MGNKCETGNVKRFFLLLLGSFLSLSAWAQTGVICGTVSDAKFKDALIGASVVIEGTTVGAIADVEGNFRIENVKPGKYTIVASYVSYKSETIRDVVVKAHQESVLRIELSDADLQLQNVVVVAQRKLGTETAIINTVRKSLPVVSGISAQQIGKTQDSDAAEVLRRIPGLTIVDDRFVVVRGLAQRYNNVWLNKATTPSSETDSRAFSFDVLPSSLIDNMMVYKSPSAELPADFSGGFVQVMTKNIPDVRPIQGNLAARIRYRRISTKWTGLPAMLLLPIGNRTARSSIPSSTRRRRIYRITTSPMRCAITRT